MAAVASGRSGATAGSKAVAIVSAAFSGFGKAVTRSDRRCTCGTVGAALRMVNLSSPSVAGMNSVVVPVVVSPAEVRVGRA